MEKCKYCDKKAIWLNPIKGYYMCDEHADMKVKQLMGDCNAPLDDTKKDWFLKIADRDDVNLTVYKG